MSDDDSTGSLTPRQKKALTRVTSDRAMIAALATAGLIAAFMQTIVTPIIPRLPELLGTNRADASWVLIATLLASAICTPISGRLGDMYGKRRIVLLLLAIMTFGSIVCALSDTLIPMIVGRALQGIGLGVIALGISILRDVLHPKALSGAVALVSATLGVGGAIGLPLAAYIAQVADWHWLFWLATLLSVVAIVVVATVIPVSTLRSGGRFDFIGAIGFAIALICILLPISKGPEWGWTSPATLAPLIGGVVLLILWGLYELRTRNALIDLRVAARRPVLLTNLASISIGFSFFVITATLPIVLELPTVTGIGLGLPLVLASLCLTPLGFVMFITSRFAGKLSDARGPRTSLILGAGITTIGFVAAIPLLDSVWGIVIICTISGLGVGFAYSAMPTLIMRSVPNTETAAANGLNSVMRTLGSTVSATVIGVILASNSTIIANISVPEIGAFIASFVLGASVTLVGMIIAFFIPKNGVNYDTSSIPVQRAP